MIYRVKTVSLKYYHREYDIDNKEVFDSLLLRLHKEFPFSDVFTTAEPANIKTHIHTDIESRIFLSGNAIFNVDGVEIYCGAGSYVYIDANIPHSFIYDGGEELKVIRFFKTNENWKAIYTE